MKTTPEQSNDSVIDTALLIRLIAASIIFAVSLVLKIPAFLQTILLAVAAITAGYDAALLAVVSARKRDYFATPILILLVTLAAFITGFNIEGTALIILYQLGAILIAYFQDRASKIALSYVSNEDNGIYEHLSNVINDKEYTSTAVESEMEHSAGSVLKLAIVFAVLFAAGLPLLTGFSYRVSIHRALAMILVCNTGSVIASIPSIAAISMCINAEKGIVADKAESLEALANVDVAVFDKSGVFTDSSPKIVSVETSKLDRATFAAFAAHAVYYSDQPFAQAVAELYNKEYRLDVINSFVDIPGKGVQLSIGGAHAIFAKRELFADMGVSLPTDIGGSGQVYYMTVADKYVGKVTVSNELNSASENLVSDCMDEGVLKFVLLTEDSREDSAAFAEDMQFNGLFSQCDTTAKLKCISDIKSASPCKLMYIYSNGLQTHSDADVDIRVSRKSKYADILVLPEYLSNLPSALNFAKRMKEVSVANALIAFIVKAALIFLAITGYCNMWLAVLADSAAAIATIISSNRVSKESVVSIYKYKSGK